MGERQGRLADGLFVAERVAHNLRRGCERGLKGNDRAALNRLISQFADLVFE